MITRDTAVNAKPGDVFYSMAVSAKIGDVFYVILKGKLVRWRVNGACKTWKRTPEAFRLPVKHGLYVYAYITEDNAHEFSSTPACCVMEQT